MSSAENVVSSKDLSALLEREELRFAARPPDVIVGNRKWTMPLLMLTSRRLLVVKERLLGKPRVEFAVD